jgi:hypothetical protein
MLASCPPAIRKAKTRTEGRCYSLPSIEMARSEFETFIGHAI